MVLPCMVMNSLLSFVRHVESNICCCPVFYSSHEPRRHKVRMKILKAESSNGCSLKYILCSLTLFVSAEKHSLPVSISFVAQSLGELCSSLVCNKTFPDRFGKGNLARSKTNIRLFAVATTKLFPCSYGAHEATCGTQAFQVFLCQMEGNHGPRTCSDETFGCHCPCCSSGSTVTICIAVMCSSRLQAPRRTTFINSSF